MTITDAEAAELEAATSADHKPKPADASEKTVSRSTEAERTEDEDFFGDVLEEMIQEDGEAKEASNDQWAYDKADALMAKLPKMEGHDRRTEGEVFDNQTMMTLHRLLSHGVLRSLDFPISTGKEANVFRGTTPEGGFVAVKIYRINTATFKHVLKYIQGDDRFQGVTGDKRSLVLAWAQKEYRNLIRMREANVPVPEPIKVLNNVLITEFIGTEDGAWPKLKDVDMDRATAKKFYEELAEDYVKIYNHAGLVHGDLSDYNILVENADLVGEKIKKRVPRARIIDVGQAVLTNHPMAWEFLDRDLRNLCVPFKRARVPTDADAIKRRLT